MSLHTVIASSGERISTPAAYKCLDSEYACFNGSVKTGGEEKLPLIMKDIREGKLSEEGIFNIFEEPAFRTSPKAKSAKSMLTELGARCAMMSGSGPSVFGVFDNAESAVLAAEALKKEGYRTFYAKSAV